MDDPTKDTIPRSAVEYYLRKETVNTNPDAYESHERFIAYMDDPDISQFGHWMHSNGFNCALVSIAVDLDKIPSVTPSAQPDNQVNLCDSCKYSYPDCPSEADDVIFGNGKGNDNICACNKYRPFAQPEQRWIPCSEKLPEDGRCLVTRFDFVTNTCFLDILWYEKGIWWNRLYTGGFAVIAWMSLPEPYRGEGEEV